MFSQYVGSCVIPRPNVSGFHVPGEEKRGKLRNRKKRFPAVKNQSGERVCELKRRLPEFRTRQLTTNLYPLSHIIVHSPFVPGVTIILDGSQFAQVNVFMMPAGHAKGYKLRCLVGWLVKK
ncbi:hypothetical protein PRIPAC_82569 [Pristionchus pacificus]|uniref:Uncharacterized protein n=1 Tax=Pristionchus pacificus TaxID=54126 RepID=A0A2A6BHZ4_PRIPA|nr:hypothetical protein PRIPAC_79739 [Pristionchus pacificus]KAF8376140.1 hypothetical protein PRIPAC_82569 [Pristionchus pacificus]|eukprot:PDM65442.1 hypothetical protein PRIPAC_52384 [Pristionchus pacificus]